MAINPVLARQTPQLNASSDFAAKISATSPSAYHIHITQKPAVLALLASQGYEVITVSHSDAQRFLESNDFSHSPAMQLADNTVLEQPPQDGCLQAQDDCPPECLDREASSAVVCPEHCQGTMREQPCAEAECPDSTRPGSDDCIDTQPVPQSAQSKPAPQGSGSVSIRQGFRLPKLNLGGGGSRGDSAAVMLIVIGVVVIAALFIYAGKWLVDMISNDEDYYAYWWDFGTQFMRLDTAADEHGTLSGIKFSGGFVANMHTHFGLTAELGQMDLDLRYNRSSLPQRLKLEGTYWLLGPTVRWLLANTDKDENLAHNTYIYLELLGGRSDRSEVDIIGVARLGVNTGLGEHLRLGLHYGAFYLGMDESQGFANDGDNYWNMLGLEIGYQF